METTTTPTGVITQAMVETLSTEVQAVVDALSIDNAKGFNATVAHIGKMWKAVEPLYAISNALWHSNDKNKNGTDQTPAKFFELLEGTGTFVLDERITKEACMASRQHSLDAVSDYQGEAKGFVNVGSYLTFLVKRDRAARTSGSSAKLTDEQTRALEVQRMGYLFDAMIPAGSTVETRTQILLGIVNDAQVELASCKVALGDDLYRKQVRDFGTAKRRLTGLFEKS
jgi:hypothetical protein